MEEKEKRGYTMTPEEAIQYSKIAQRIIDARAQRETPRDEFDGMSYEQTYLSNRRAAMSYLTPKKNDDEVRVNTGTTEKRIELVMNELLALNVGTDVLAFDKDDNLLAEVGETFTDLVNRTKQIERADDKRLYFYKELLTQPSLFVEELWVEEKIPNNSKKGFRVRNRCERRMIQGVQMYLGDVSMPDVRFNEQPYLVKYCRMSKSEGEKIFKELNPTKWATIKPGAYITVGSPDTNLYRKGSLLKDEIEAFYYMSYPDNELQIYVQGVPFLETKAKYSKIYGNLGGYHITMVGLNPYSWDFAYSKPLTQSAKTLQALDNETIRNLIRKFRQALEPPLGVPKGKIYSRDIWNPGSMAQGVKASDFEKLIDHTGVTPGEMSMFDLIEKKTNEFIGTSQQEPLTNKGQVTATELMLAQKNAIKMLGNSVLAVMRLEERADMLRVRNILENHTKPVDKQLDPISGIVKDVYARFSLGDQDIKGQQGTKVIQMMDRGVTRDEELSMYAEEVRGKEAGKPVAFAAVNVPVLLDLDLYFYVNASSKERGSDQAEKIQFGDMLNQAAGITKLTGLPLNPQKITQRFERIYKEKDLFEKEAPQQMMDQNGQPVQGQAPGLAGNGLGQMPDVSSMAK